MIVLLLTMVLMMMSKKMVMLMNDVCKLRWEGREEWGNCPYKRVQSFLLRRVLDLRGLLDSKARMVRT